jgi:RNA polymerase sigma-70 factor (ECF subfamily)
LIAGKSERRDACAAPVRASSSCDIDSLARTQRLRLTSFLQRRVGNACDVEDLVQDTFLEALRCVDSFRGGSVPTTWLFGIALNLTRTYYRRAKVRDIYSEVDVQDVRADDSGDPAKIFEERQRLSRAAASLAGLPTEMHCLLELMVDGELSYEQIARTLDVPVGTVRSRISRLRLRLRHGAEEGNVGRGSVYASSPSQPRTAATPSRAN